MIKGSSVLAIIPARGGSKGIPRKNIRALAGKPLLAWTTEAAKKSKYIDRLIISSDDQEIIDVAKKFQCEAPFKRPSALAADDTPGIAPVLHALQELPNYDLVVLLQPTSPLRTTADIDSCIELLMSKAVNSCVSVAEATKSPYWMYTLDDAQHLVAVIKSAPTYEQRQDVPKVFALNGAVYVARTKWLLENKTFLTADTAAHVMPPERSIDVDTELDWICAEAVLAAGAKTGLKTT